MAILTKLSPVRIEDTEMWCDLCEEETLHVSYYTKFIKTGETGYLLECEPCMLSADWQ